MSDVAVVSNDSPLAIEGKSPRELAWARLSRDKFALVAIGVIVTYLLVAALAPVICSVFPGIFFQATSSF